jgi:hypothetical protein
LVKAAWVLVRRRNALFTPSIGFVVRKPFHWLFGKA